MSFPDPYMIIDLTPLQSIFADGSYDKPAFLTWLNSSTFMLAMVPTLVRSALRLRREGKWDEQMAWVRERYDRGGLRLVLKEDEDISDEAATTLLEDSDTSERESFLKPDDDDLDSDSDRPPSRPKNRKRTHLALLPTARLSFFFCFLWFAANYFAMACLKYTTVASATILTSTSSIFTLLIGALTRTEKFTFRKLFGVMASLAGIVLISKVDLSTKSPATKRALDEFPDKTPAELLLGDSLALLSAVLYGVYTITLKRTTLLNHPLELNMPLFFGLVGTFNFFLLLPIFPILHFTGVEPFMLPPNKRIWTILLINSASSLLSDICWAYAMILTSPLVVTVGLSLTIPLSLVGEMIIQGRFESWVYWVGAGIVVGSFLFVDGEERKDEGEVLKENVRIRAHRRSASLRSQVREEGGSGDQEGLDHR
jgi:solute carrier family 35, member F5